MNTIQRQDPVRPERTPGVVQDFLSALTARLTYSPRKNPDVLFGFLWGIPIPFFALIIHAHALRSNFDLAFCLSIVQANPIYLAFVLHPFIFAVVFGALGTMRADREHHIRELLAQSVWQREKLEKANVRLNELDRLKSEFLANVTHELRSPLVTALGYTDRILGLHLGEITDRQRHGLEVSKRNLQRLRELINEILDFSRLDAGVARFKMAPNDLAASVNAAVDGLTLRAKARNIAIKINVPPKPAMVIGDAAKLTQVAVNLLDNAIKFSKDGGTVLVSIAADDNRWHLTVADEGVGIAPDVLPKLFGRFVQEDGSLARNYDGIGLGLVIVKKIVDAHGGRVWIESKQGEGAKVLVELPAAPLEAAHATLKNEKEPAHV